MRKKIVQLVTNPLISGSAVIFIGTFISNIFNFLYNYFMSRNLSVADYGTLASLISLITLASMPAASILPTVVKFAASYYAKHDLSLIKGLLYKVSKAMFLFGVLFLLFFILLQDQIATFFKIGDSFLIVIAGITVFFGFLGTITAAFLQGKLQFTYLTFVHFSGASLKLILGVLLVLSGYKLGGAMTAFAISFITPFIVGLIPLRGILQKNVAKTRVSTKEVFFYGAPAALTLLSITSFVSTDLILVKHFFTPEDAGKYAVLSLIGRIIFYFTGPIGTVMFPMVVQRYTKKEEFKNIFKLSLLLVAAPSLLMSLFYFLFPQLTISIFNTNKSYISLAPYLGIFAVYISVFSIASVLANFFLSINKTNIVIPTSIAAIMQIVLIWFFHNSFLQVIVISLACVSLLLITLLLYYLKLSRGK